MCDDSKEILSTKAEFNRAAWREGLQALPPAARAAMAAVAAKNERPTPLDIDRMVAGLGAAQEIEDQAE
jgi:hypothetical protein